ncbi:CpaF family protein [Coprococcus sp. AF21-14LB]|uniref:CpaF family protein n=1 Tax=Coprococcus sp. AF21-14LB TaxID=2292231 RepID=UPI001FA915B8|nr:CpaF family protein [Coprococcus sp. AF21-14LB]
MEQRKRNVWIEEIQEEILSEIDLSKEVEDDTLAEMIREILELHSSREFIPLKEKASIGKELFNTFRKLDIIQEFLEDEEVTEIMINGTEKIFVEKHGQLYEVERHFYSKKKLEDVIQQIVAGANRIVNEASPIVDARLPDGSRVNVVLSPTALNGPIVTIRKFPKEAVTMQQLVYWGALDEETAEFLKLLVKSKYNIFISGGTGSGKTTFLNALSEFIPEDERVITIEDNAELKIQGIRNLVRLEARNANVEGIGEITIQDLFKSALRMRPDRILVGEVRQFEAFSMIEAMSSGHPGSMSTGHANSPQDMLMRLETMILTGLNIPLLAIQRKIASGVDIIVHLSRFRDKSRKVAEIVEVLDCAEEGIRVNKLYEFVEESVSSGKICGKLVKCGALTQREKLLAAGYS